MRRFAILAAVFFLPGCCFIGCDEEVMFVPKTEISVTDGQDHPVPAAVVTLARYEENPHFRPLDSWSSQAGPDGKATFDYKRGTITQYPMMMHGVGTFAWQFCVEAPGRKTVVRGWNETVAEDELVKLEFALPKGDSDPCSEVVEHEVFDSVPEQRVCETDADCTYADRHPDDCCEVCYQRVINAETAKETKQKCGDETPGHCRVCEPSTFRDKPPRCLAGVCRGPK